MISGKTISLNCQLAGRNYDEQPWSSEESIRSPQMTVETPPIPGRFSCFRNSARGPLSANMNEVVTCE